MKQHAAVFRISRPQHGPMPTPRGLLRVLLVALCLCLAQSSTVWAQTSSSMPLPPAAQEALNKGIIAAKVPDYLLAIRYFEEARKLAPQAPVVFLNMGLAESRIPGRELRAMAWFGAYLAAYPDAPNAAAVQGQIGVLEVRNQSTISRLLKTVQDAASQLSGGSKDLALLYVAILWVNIGDSAVALKTADLIQDRKNQARQMIVKAQVETGDIVGAKKNAELIQHEGLRDQAYEFIVIGQIRAGGYSEDAWKTVDLIKEPDYKNFVRATIFTAQREGLISNSPDSTKWSASNLQFLVQPPISVSDWLKKLDDDNKSNDCPLNTGPFLDLSGYLKSLPPNDDPKKVFDSLHKTAETIVNAHNIITKMLKQEAKK